MWRQPLEESPPEANGDDEGDSDDEGGGRRAAAGERDSDTPQCYICYEQGEPNDPLINPCQCAGSVKYGDRSEIRRSSRLPPSRQAPAAAYDLVSEG